mgnify:CR=1 FL=1
MHPTSSTLLSDAISRMIVLREKLHHASFIPQEELLGLLVAGSLIIQRLAEETETTQFTEEEVALVEEVSIGITRELESIYGIEEDYLYDNDQVVEDYFSENPENEDWDS